MIRSARGRGFTLIELLVVIAIIGLLSSVVLASLNSARARARDARRMADLRQIMTALEAYYADTGRYPGETACDSSRGSHSVSCSSVSGPSWSTSSQIYMALVPDYISTLPVDPQNNSYDHSYKYEPQVVPNDYCLSVRLERDGSYFRIKSGATAIDC